MTVAVTSPRLVGRAAEIEALGRALEEAHGGSTRTVVLQGPPGLGKSRLAAEFLRRATTAGATVAVGTCVDLGEATLPYAAVADVLQQLRRQLGLDALTRAAGPWAPRLASFLPELGVARDAPARATSHAELLRAVRDLLHATTEVAPLVVVVEDVHWADAATRDVLAYVARTLRDARLLVIVTVRDDELHAHHPLLQVLHELRRDPAVVTLPLAGLSRSEIAEQVRAIRGRPPSRVLLDRLVERSGGNPFFVEELLATGGDGDDLPPTLREALLARVGGLPPVTRRVLDAAAVLGRRFDDGLLEAVLEADPDALDAALLEAIDRQLLVRDGSGDGYRFRHVLLQEAVHDQLGPTARRRLHAAAADALSRRPTGSGGHRSRILAELAHHLVHCGRQEEALRTSVSAGRAAAEVFAFDQAARHFRRALELWDVVGPHGHDGTDRTELLEAAAEATWYGLGDAVAASELLREALTLLPDVQPDVRRAAMLSRLAGFTHETGASAAEGLDLHEHAIALLGDEQGPLRARVLGRYARALLIASRLDDAERHAHEALEHAVGHGSTVDELDARVTVLTCRGLRGEMDAAMRAIADLRTAVGWAGEPDLVARYYNNATVLAYNAGRYADAVRMADEGDAVLRRLGVSDDDRMMVAVEGAAALTAMGRLDEALSRLQKSDPSMTAARISVAIERGNALRMLGDLDGARAELDVAATEGASRKDPAFALLIHAYRADVEAWAGAYDRAWLEIESAVGSLDGHVDVMGAALALATGVRVLAEHPEPGTDVGARADDLVGRLERLVTPVAGSMPVLEALLLTAGGERSRLGAPDQVRWGQAAAAWQRLQRPYDVAYADLRRAEALEARGAAVRDVDQARRQARRTAERIGAEALLRALEPGGPSTLPPVVPQPDTVEPPSEVTLERGGEFWHVIAGETDIILKDTLGLHYLSQLIANPGVEIHAAELVSGTGPSPAVARPSELTLVEAGLGPALDAQAKAAYRRRVDDLREEIEDADRCNDTERAARAREEYDVLLGELARAVGLGGRDRPTRAPGERARINTTKAIRAVIRRLGEHDASLAHDLDRAIRTGTFSCYQPLAAAPRWRVVR